MAKQCIWANVPGRSGLLHVSGSTYTVGPSAQYDRTAVCELCRETIGVDVGGTWFNVLRKPRGGNTYEKATFAQFRDHKPELEESNSRMVEKKVRV